MVFTIITFIRRRKKNDARKKTEECKSFKFQEAPEESKKIILTNFKTLNFTGHGRDRVGSHNLILHIFTNPLILS